MSLRYSIYKVQTHSLSASPVGLTSELLYSSTSCRICQSLFTSFFKFFCAICCPPSFRFSSDNFDMISQNFRFVKNFFLFFRISLIHFRRPAGDLHILAPRPPFVKHYFTNFPPFLCCFCHTDICPFICVHPLFSAGQMAADLCQCIPCIHTAFLLKCQIPKAHHSAQPSVLCHRQPPDLLPPHETCRHCRVHIRHR